MIAEHSGTTGAKQSGSSALLVRIGDWVIATAVLAAMIVEIWVIADVPWSTTNQILATIIAPVLAGPLAFRATHPLQGFAVNSVATWAMVAVGYDSGVYPWANLFLLFTVSVAYRGRESVGALIVGIMGVAFFFLELRDENRDGGAA